MSRVELEAALIAADEELGHQLRRVAALEQECCRLTTEVRSALRSAAAAERSRAAAEARAAASDAEVASLRKRCTLSASGSDAFKSREAPRHQQQQQSCTPFKSPPHGPEDPTSNNPPANGSLSNELRLRRLVLRLEQQLNAERLVHASQLRKQQEVGPRQHRYSNFPSM